MLPGGVLGDVHRGVRHGRDVGDVGRGLRAVAWERFAGQVVQVALALVVLIACRLAGALVDADRAAPVVVGGALAPCVRADPRGADAVGSARAGRADVRDGLLARRAWPRITVASVVVVVGPRGDVPDRRADRRLDRLDGRLLPLAMLVLLAMAVPTNIGGWGPREGVAAWLFAAAGLGAGSGRRHRHGLRRAWSSLASLPGARRAAAGSIPGRAGRSAQPTSGAAAARAPPVIAGREGASHG